MPTADYPKRFFYWTSSEMFLSKMYESPPQPVNLNFVCKLVEFCFKFDFCIVLPFSSGLENVAHLKKQNYHKAL